MARIPELCHVPSGAWICASPLEASRSRTDSGSRQVVGAAHLHAVTGIEEQPDIGSLQLRSEVLHDPVKCSFVEIKLRASATSANPRSCNVSATSLASFAGLSSQATLR